MCVGTAIFVGFGAMIAQILPLSLFHASCLVIAATFVFTTVVFVLVSIMRSHSYYDSNDYYEYGDEFDEDIFSDMPNFSKVGRNDKCPCGSGKKFKNCCGKI